MVQSHILIIEDDKKIRRFVQLALEAESYKVFEAETMQQGLIDSATRKPELIILDLALPDGDGLDFIRDIRQWSQTPIIVLSARTHEEDKIKALDYGADDFLTKPFGVGELLARVRAILRRHLAMSHESPIISFADIKIDLIKHYVTKGTQEVHLTPIEFKLLTELTAHPGKVLTQRHLLTTVWGADYLNQTHYLRIYMRRLRQRIEDNPAKPKYLLTETGIGYRFVNNDSIA